MSALRPKLGIELPSGHSSHGTRKLLSMLLGECHGADIHKTLPPKPQLSLAEQCLVPPDHPKFEKQGEHGTSLNLHPPSPITHFTHQILSLFTQTRLRNRLHPTNAPHYRGEVSSEQKGFMQSPTVRCSHAFPRISYRNLFTKSIISSIRWISIIKRIKSAWNNAIQLHTHTRISLSPIRVHNIPFPM